MLGNDAVGTLKLGPCAIDLALRARAVRDHLRQATRRGHLDHVPLRHERRRVWPLALTRARLALPANEPSRRPGGQRGGPVAVLAAGEGAP